MNSFWKPVRPRKPKKFKQGSLKRIKRFMGDPTSVRMLNKNIYPLRSQAEWRLIVKDPLGDSDHDKLMNAFDCKPLNKKKQDTLVTIYKKKAQKYLPQVQKLAKRERAKYDEQGARLRAPEYYEDIKRIMEKPGKKKQLDYPSGKLSDDKYLEELKKTSALYRKHYGGFPEEKELHLIIDKKKVVGFVDTSHHGRPSFVGREGYTTRYVDTIYIEPEHRKKGISTKVIKGMLQDKRIKEVTGELTEQSKKFWKGVGAEVMDSNSQKHADTFTINSEKFEEKHPEEVIYSWQTKNEENLIYPSELGGSSRSPMKGYRGRHTGHFGTGIYGYTTKGSALREPYGEDRKLIKIKIDKPLKVKDTGEKAQGYMAGSEFHSKLREIEEVTGPKDLTRAEYIIRAFKKQGVKDVTADELTEANKEWEKTGVKQANIILGKRGYTGIYPPRDLSTHAYGALKFETKKVPFDAYEEVYAEPTPEVLSKIPEIPQDTSTEKRRGWYIEYRNMPPAFQQHHWKISKVGGGQTRGYPGPLAAESKEEARRIIDNLPELDDFGHVKKSILPSEQLGIIKNVKDYSENKPGLANEIQVKLGKPLATVRREKGILKRSKGYTKSYVRKLADKKRDKWITEESVIRQKARELLHDERVVARVINKEVPEALDKLPTNLLEQVEEENKEEKVKAKKEAKEQMKEAKETAKEQKEFKKLLKEEDIEYAGGAEEGESYEVTPERQKEYEKILEDLDIPKVG